MKLEVRSEKLEVKERAAEKVVPRANSARGMGVVLLLTSTFSLLTSLSGCASSRTITPTGAEQWRVGLYPGAVALPDDPKVFAFPTGLVSGSYGFTDALEVGAGVNPIALLVGRLNVDQQLAVAWTGATGTGITVMSAFRATEDIDLANAHKHLYPEFETTVSYPLTERWRPYIGASMWSALSPDSVWSTTLFAGVQMRLHRGHAFQADVCWLGPLHPHGWALGPLSDTTYPKRGTFSVRFGWTFTWGEYGTATD